MSSQKGIWRSTIGGIILSIVAVIVGTRYADSPRSFIIGFLTCLIAGGFILLVLYRRPAAAGATRQGSARLIFGGSIILAVALIAGFTSLRLESSIETDRYSQDLEVRAQEAWTEAMRRSGQSEILAGLLSSIESELDSSSRVLSNPTIDRISTLAHVFPPYYTIQDDTLTARAVSPERGILLLALLDLQIDTSSLKRIFLRTSFEGAGLNGADLDLAYLKGVNLQSASLRNASLQGANLDNANLSRADLWGAKLNNCNAKGADMKRAEMSWTELNNTDLSSAELSSAKLSSAKIRDAVLHKTQMQYALLDNAFLTSSILTGCEARGSKFQNAHLSNIDGTRMGLRRADLSGANLTDAILSQANLTEVVFNNTVLEGTIMDSAKVSESDWAGFLVKGRIVGEVQNYQSIPDTTNASQFILVNLTTQK